MTETNPTPCPPRRKLGADAARAVGRFRPEGPLGYRAKYSPGAPLRDSRQEAEADQRAHLEQTDVETKERA